MRQEVKWFAEQMENKLRENDHKDDWQDCDPLWLLERIYEELWELRFEVSFNAFGKRSDYVINKAADVANYAMMIADLAKREAVNADSTQTLLGA